MRKKSSLLFNFVPNFFAFRSVRHSEFAPHAATNLAKMTQEKEVITNEKQIKAEILAGKIIEMAVHTHTAIVGWQVGQMEQTTKKKKTSENFFERNATKRRQNQVIVISFLTR